MSSVIRETALSLVRPVARRMTSTAARVFMYHRFGRPGEARKMSMDVFEDQIRYLRDHYQIVPLRELVDRLGSNETLKQRYVAITVDDGYADFAEYAYPVLSKYRVPATVYLVSKFVDQELWLWFDAIHYLADRAPQTVREVVLQERRIPLDLTKPGARHGLWETVADMGVGMSPAERSALIDSFRQQVRVDLPAVPSAQYAGMTWKTVQSLDPELVEWGGHTATHPILSKCSPHEQFVEISAGKRRIEEITQRACVSFCYPNGQPADYDVHTVQAAKQAGYTNAVVAHGGMVSPGCDPFLIERLGAPDTSADFRKCVDGVWEMRRRLSRARGGRLASAEAAPRRTY